MIFFFLQNDLKKSQKCQKCKSIAKMPKSEENINKAGFHRIGATIRTRRKSRCLPYAGFLFTVQVWILKSVHSHECMKRNQTGLGFIRSVDPNIAEKLKTTNTQSVPRPVSLSSCTRLTKMRHVALFIDIHLPSRSVTWAYLP